MGDFRTYGYTVVLRAVTTDDFMTAEWAKIPYDVLERAGSRIKRNQRYRKGCIRYHLQASCNSGMGIKYKSLSTIAKAFIFGRSEVT